jgi:hypothetical protein
MELERALRQLAAFARGDYPEDQSALLACSELFALLPARARAALEAPNGERNLLALTALEQLIAGDKETAELVAFLAAPPKAGPVSQPTPGPPPLRLQLLAREGRLLEVRATRGPGGGELRAQTFLPFEAGDLAALLRAIEGLSHPAQGPGVEDLAALQRLRLLGDAYPDKRVMEGAGRLLHDTLLAPPIGEMVRATIDAARAQGGAAHVELCFDEDSVSIARYPWELIHDGRRFLIHDDLRLSRYIAYPETPSPFQLQRPLHVLHVAPCPRGYQQLPREGHQATIETALGPAQVVSPARPTLTWLIDALERFRPQVLHFCGHGLVFRQCPVCGERHFPGVPCCDSAPSGAGEAPAQGYLAFEDDDGRADWVPGSRLGNELRRRGVQLAVLMACSSAVVHGRSVFNGAGPGLIRAGVPAVIAAQSTLTVRGGWSFTEGLYRSLGYGKSLPEAVSDGRSRLLDGDEWHVPVLYLRQRL